MRKFTASYQQMLAALGRAPGVAPTDPEERCHENVLDGSISLGEVEAHSARLSRDQEIIFYCA